MKIRTEMQKAGCDRDFIDFVYAMCYNRQIDWDAYYCINEHEVEVTFLEGIRVSFTD
jgi:hypothetical protein